MLTAFSSPKDYGYKVGQNLMVNGVDIFREMGAAYTNFKAEEYEAFGKDVGICLAMILIGSVRPNDKRGEAFQRQALRSIYTSGGDTLEFHESNKEFVDYLERVVHEDIYGVGEEDEDGDKFYDAKEEDPLQNLSLGL